MPVLEVILAIGPYEDRSSSSLPGFVDRLITWLPSLHRHGWSLGRPGGFVERLRRGTYLPHIVEHVTLALQEQMGFDVSLGRARGTGEPGVYRVLFAYREEEPARFNVSDVQGVQLVIDYGHNVAAMRALSEAVAALGRRRTVMLLGLPGDRRDEDLRATLEANLACADAYVLYDQIDRRGRAPGMVPELLRAALPGDTPAVCAPSQEAGIREAWSRVRAGDRLIVIADEVDEALALVQELAAATLHDSLCVWPISQQTAPQAAA